LIEKTQLIEKSNTILVFLLKENEELIKIIAKSIVTSKSR